MMQGRVLIAEDEGLIAEELRDRLEEMGLSVVDVVASGEAAIARAHETVPDLLLMDIRLHGNVDGIEAARRIRQEINVPVIYVTAHSDDATIVRAKQTDPIGYVMKPFAGRELQITIEMGLHRHAVECRLAESRELFASTLTSIADAVITTNTEGRITYMNPAAEALTRWPAGDAVHKPLDEVLRLVDRQTAAPVESPVTQLLRDGVATALGESVRLVTRAGVETPIADATSLIHDAQGHVRGAVFACHDISSRLQAQQALRRAEDLLRQSQKLEALGRLAGGVAHDVNNLMTVVIGCGDMLLEDLPAGTPQHHLVTEMTNAGERSVSLARQLLAFGRKQILIPSVMSLNDLVRGAHMMVRRIIGEDVNVVLDLHDDIAPVKVDPGQMEQVIINLAVNARDAMPHGGTLTFHTNRMLADGPALAETPDVKPGRYTVLSVADTGVGMDEQTRAHIFEPFFTTKDVGKGTGLGLATVYGIVKQSGGYIYVHSCPGAGTTFRIYLPEVCEQPSPRPSREPSPPVRGAETILLVEDDDNVRALTRSILERAGYRVLEAADGVQALGLYEHGVTFDLLLTDAILPHLSGRLLADRLAVSRPGLKVLFMSGYTEDHILRHGVQDATIPFLQKPFYPADLTAAVRRALDS